MFEEEDWIVAVFMCKSNDARNILLQFSSFMKDIEDIKSFHFIIRDRVEDKVVFSYRFLIDKNLKRVIKSKIRVKLNQLVSKDDYAIDPKDEDPFSLYVAWPWKEAQKKRGPEKFKQFYELLNRFSSIVLDMAANNYFNTKERVELAHVMSWMLGCTEYGLLSPQEMQVGYYDRITDQYNIYLTQSFKKTKKKG
jgi:hypothetical protein